MIQTISNKLHPYRFKSLFNLDQRRNIYEKLENNSILASNQDTKNSLIIVVEPSAQFIETQKLDTSKKLYKTLVVKKELKCQQLLQNIRNLIKLNSKESFFLYCAGKILTPDNKLADLEVSKQQDGLIYILYGISDSF